MTPQTASSRYSQTHLCCAVLSLTTSFPVAPWQDTVSGTQCSVSNAKQSLSQLMYYGQEEPGGGDGRASGGWVREGGGQEVKEHRQHKAVSACSQEAQ